MSKTSSCEPRSHLASGDPDYAAVSETPGDDVLPAAVDMAQTRYVFADRHAVGRIIVEIACGTGHGLGLLASRGRQAVGIDITQQLLVQARRNYRSRAGLVRGDALAIPLRSGAADTLVVFEAIYYFRDIAAFLVECHRVLRSEGRLVVCWANPEHYEFSPGAYTFRYPTATGMQSLLTDNGFRSTVHGGFPTPPEGSSQRFRSALKRTAGRLGLIPGGMRAKAFLKRAFYGNLVRFPVELVADGTSPTPPVPLGPLASASNYRVLYAVATKVA